MVVVGRVWYDDDDDWYGKRILSRIPTTSTHSFNTSVAIVLDKVEEKDDEASLPVATNIGVCGNAVDDRGSLG